MRVGAVALAATGLAKRAKVWRRAPAVRARAGGPTFAATLVVLPAAILQSIALVGSPGTFELSGSRIAANVLVGLLVLAPALTAIAAARIGLPRIARALCARPDTEHQLAIWRILAGLALFGYALVLAVADAPEPEPRVSCPAVAAVGLVGAWLMLLLILIRPSPAPLRLYAGLAADAVVLSAFLHLGGGAAAAAFPGYLLAIFYCGKRFGAAALGVAAGGSLLGFGTVVATTEFWRAFPMVSAAFLAVLAIVAAVASMLLRAVVSLRRETAKAAKRRDLSLNASGAALRQAIEAASHLRGEGDPAAADRSELRGHLQDAVDLLSLASGAFAPQSEAFDLHLLVNDVMAGLRPVAAGRAVRLRASVDPAIPFQLRGPKMQVARILQNIAFAAIETTGRGTVRLVVEASMAGEHGLHLAFRLHAGSGSIPFDWPRIPIAEELAGSIGGEVILGESDLGSAQISAILPVALDQTAAPGVLDLADRPVLIVTDDSKFAGELAEPLNNWRADPCWIGGAEPAFDYLSRLEAREQTVLVVDGQGDPLAALSFVHRARNAANSAAFIIFVARPDQAARIGEFAADACDAVLVGPVSVALLGNALHALPPDQNEPARGAGGEPKSPATDPAPRPVSEAGRVTPITVHPRFIAEPSDAVDVAVIANLRKLGGGDDFLAELVEGLREEARPIIERIGRTAAEADLAGFCGAVTTLRRCAGNVGGTRLCEVASTLRHVTGEELRDHGGEYVHRLAAELARLDAALVEWLGAPDARRE